ncbi:hypothetical protein [Streptomyces sp. DSM 40907]|uniref:hypothetical protein n=1 Tax=Streptomyces kutzneri TaxID=3051179 RepID=UPI0028D87894|nr:hypothetical protein [Streptomyces sp. DSM 40907]
MNKRLPLWLAGVCLLALGCEAQRDTQAAPAVSAHAATPRSSAQDLLLAEQFQTGGYGAGSIGCETPSRPDLPLAWLLSDNTMAEGPEVRLGGLANLCLYGFPENRPITLTVNAGGQTYTTPVVPVASNHVQELSQNTLFDNRAIEVQVVGNHLLQSTDWTFLPSDPARTAIALSGGLTLTASSGDVTSTYEVPLHWDQGAEPLEGWEHSREMAVYGYLAGARVPIGLYRIDENLVAVLERQIGHVVMPPSRVAVFTIPEDVLRLVSVNPPADKATHCLSVPGVEDCVTQP